jgi:polyisoprenoid-binding protein YceI
MKLSKIIITSLFASTLLFAGTYNVDVSHSSVGFSVKHLMISNVKGNFSDFSGSFEYDEVAHKLQKLQGIVKVASIDTGIEKRDAHLKSADFFNAPKNPDITFTLTKVEDDKAYGELTMAGVTKAIVLEYESGGSIKDPWGNQRVGISLHGKISREAFGITWNKILETGGVTVGDSVKIEVELEGILAK